MDIINNAKEIYELIKKFNNLDLLEKMADLRDQILALREENQQLKEKLSHKEEYNMVFEGTCYWNEKEDGSKEGPFCPTCWDKDGKAIRMHSSYVGVAYKGAEDNIYSCHACKNNVRK